MEFYYKKIMKINCMLTILLILFLSFTPIVLSTHASHDSLEELTSSNNQCGIQNKTVLVTGFKPFHIYPVNPSELIVNQMNGTLIQDFTIVGKVLPIDFEIASEIVQETIDEIQPAIVVCLGLAPGENTIRLEALAINIQYDPYVENPFQSLKKVDTEGPFLLRSTLNIKDSYSNLKNDNIPVKITYSAGWYLCNTVFYDTMYYLDKNKIDIPAGFIHIPQLIEDDPEGLPIDTMITAIERIIVESFE